MNGHSVASVIIVDCQLPPNSASQWPESTQQGHQPRQQAGSACPNGVQRPLARLFDAWPSDSCRHDCWSNRLGWSVVLRQAAMYWDVHQDPALVDLPFGQYQGSQSDIVSDLRVPIGQQKGIPPDPGCQDSPDTGDGLWSDDLSAER